MGRMMELRTGVFLNLLMKLFTEGDTCRHVGISGTRKNHFKCANNFINNIILKSSGKYQDILSDFSIYFS